MFKITEGDFKNQIYGDESYLSNWPMLYILENIQHIYYVLMTRGIRGTYLYICDPDLRGYISQYVDTE